jgi:16S rRNA (uracil1498-N3)-methyltransferase
MSARFFSDVPLKLGAITLSGPEAHHLLHVMRAAVGAELTLFDGRGSEFPARITRLGRNDVECEVLTEMPVDRERATPLTLAVALPKGDRQKVLVEKLTELGVTRLVPLLTERSVADKSAGGLEKLRRLVIEASKQCGRNRLMEITQPLAWAEYVASAAAPLRVIAHPAGDSSEQPPPSVESIAAIGPEGGFSDSEVELAVKSGWQRVSLGPRILRIETAAIALAAKLI